MSAYLSPSSDKAILQSEPKQWHVFGRLISYGNAGALAASLDFALATISCLIAGQAYNYFELGSLGNSSAFLAIGLDFAVLFVLLAALRGLYRTEILLFSKQQHRDLAAVWVLALLIVTAVLFLLKTGSSYSRGSTLAFGLLGLAAVVEGRSLICRWLQEAVATGNLAGPRSLVIGDPDELRRFSALDLLRDFGLREAGRVELASKGEPSVREATVGAAVALARTAEVEQIVLALKWSDAADRDLTLHSLSCLPVPVFLLPDRTAAGIFALASRALPGSRMLIELQRAPLSRFDLVMKRVVDLAVAGTSLVLLSPLLLMVSIAIKIDSEGPVIFRQRRRGFNGTEFAIFKFRTMSVLESEGKIRQATRNDKRVTRIGRFLRMSSIDELPQFFNVLRGEMSVVGPRPHAVAHDDQCIKEIENYAFRHHVKPGISGWAQVNGFRGGTAEIDLMKKRVEHDLWYINNWSIWLDLRIILRTCSELARGRNAY